jgi:hypothetical protein
MLIDITLVEGLDSIGNPELVLEETLVPSQCAKNANSPYRPEYEWLFVYERKLAGFLGKWTAGYRNELIGEKGLLCEALSNAFSHGHRKNPDLPIGIHVYLGTKGLMVRITDTGNGFDIESVRDQYQKGKTYYHLSGNGLRRMIQNTCFSVFYSDRGSGFNLVYYFDA